MKKVIAVVLFSAFVLYASAQNITAYNKKEVMIPMRDGRQDQTIHVLQHFAKILTAFRSGHRLTVFQPARLNLRQDRIFIDVIEVVGDPVDDLITVTSKVFRGHVTVIEVILFHWLDSFSGTDGFLQWIVLSDK